MKVMVTVAAQEAVSSMMKHPMSPVMKAAEVMHVAEMASRPVSRIEVIANAAGRNAARAE